MCRPHSKLIWSKAVCLIRSALRHVANWRTRLLKKLLPFVFLICPFYHQNPLSSFRFSLWCFRTCMCVWERFFLLLRRNFAIAVAFVWHSVFWRRMKMKREKRIRKCSTCDRANRESDGNAKKKLRKRCNWVTPDEHIMSTNTRNKKNVLTFIARHTAHGKRRCCEIFGARLK